MYIIGFLSFVTFIYYSTGTSVRLFSRDFRTPKPPHSILAEYQASFLQHKWDATGISNIASVVIYANLALQRLRMDLTHDGIIVSSLFDYANAGTVCE